jgi:hypothetical protein
MALRIAGKREEKEAVAPEAEAPAPEPMPTEEDLMAELPPTLDEEPVTEGGGEVDPIIAGYKGPENGPFACANCVYFGRHGDGTCAIVSGPIDPEGICNLFTSASAGQDAMPEAPLPEEEMPVEPEAETAADEGM